MSKIGFPNKWIQCILECVRSTTSFVFVNGSPTEKFKTEIGLRQGDPLSLFLFFIALEGLNVMLCYFVFCLWCWCRF